SAGYGKPTSTYCFYNQKVVTSGKIAPNGWAIPSSQDWQKLITYIQNDASVLKGGTSWIESEYPVNNLSGFYAVGAGYFDSTYICRKEQVRFWMAGDTQTSVADKVVCLQYYSNKVTEEFHKTTNALSLRMVRK
ncbi:FISUMP domain-containing protein, partial [Bacteroides graminisolvens]|uniref:FISUMP domain-containing protein n=1 Tax=Bacteroides graminisolvens TaxID=477666 RepID=UPI003B6B46B4